MKKKAILTHQLTIEDVQRMCEANGLQGEAKEISGGVSATPQTTSSSVVLFVPSKGGALHSKK